VQDPESEDFFRFSVSPDIVVHQRGTDKYNLLVIELKKASNPEIPDYDELKLQCFTKIGGDEYGYLVGFVVRALDDIAPEKRELRLFKPFAEGVEQQQNFGATSKA